MVAASSECGEDQQTVLQVVVCQAKWLCRAREYFSRTVLSATINCRLQNAPTPIEVAGCHDGTVPKWWVPRA
jgi:hypothetical protein